MDEEGISRQTRHFFSKQQSIFTGTDLQEAYQQMSREIVNEFDTYQGQKSGLVLEVVEQLNVTLSKLEPLGGSSYIPLPPAIKNKKALINLKNKDNMCFKYAVARFLHPVSKDAERVTKELREQTNNFDWTGVEFPTPICGNSIGNFEKNNNIGVALFGSEGKSVVSLRVPGKGYQKIVDLFYVKNKEGAGYYCTVKSLSRLVNLEVTKNNAKKFVCRYCLNNQHTEERLKEHVELCSKHEITKTIMPKEGSTIRFKNRRYALRDPIVIYADFESLHKPTHKVHGKTITRSEHVPAEFVIVVVSELPNFQREPIHYQGENAHKVFVEKVEQIRDEFHEQFKDSKKMVFTREDRDHHNVQTYCYSCHGEFSDHHPKGYKVRDHCHFTGKYRGALHNVCN